MIGFACGIALVLILAGIVGHRVMTIVAEALEPHEKLVRLPKAEAVEQVRSAAAALGLEVRG